MTPTPDIDEIELPTDLAHAFREVGGLDERPRTLGQGFDAITDRLNDAEIAVSLTDMYQSTPTRHAVHIGDTVQHVPCVLDALIVAFSLETDPIEIHSDPPGGGETVRFHVIGDDVTVTPKGSVTSFGLGQEEWMDPAFDSIKDSLNDPETPTPTTCTLTNAFPSGEAYDQWASGVQDAALMKLSVAQMVALSYRALHYHVAP